MQDLHHGPGLPSQGSSKSGVQRLRPKGLRMVNDSVTFSVNADDDCYDDSR